MSNPNDLNLINKRIAELSTGIADLSKRIYELRRDLVASTATIGGKGYNGLITILSSARQPILMNRADARMQSRISLDGEWGAISVGGNGVDGYIEVIDRTRSFEFPYAMPRGLFFDAGRSHMRIVGGNNIKAKLHVEGDISMGGYTAQGNLLIFPRGISNVNNYDNATIHLDGQAGDILLRNADCAEEFDVSPYDKLEPGTVVIINEEGKLERSNEGYDRRVVGIVSGAGEYKPGIVFDKRHCSNNRLPVALAGKVFCKVDATYSSIKVGDPLTTSYEPGHAMKATDSSRAFGAVIGKALKSVESSKSLIPVLVSLQ